MNYSKCMFCGEEMRKYPKFCPICGSNDIEELHHCDECGEDWVETIGHTCDQANVRAIKADRIYERNQERERERA